MYCAKSVDSLQNRNWECVFLTVVNTNNYFFSQILYLFIVYLVFANGSRMHGCSAEFMCLSVCLSVFPHNISKTDAARITKLNRHDPPWVLETHLFWGQKIKGQGHEAQSIAGVGHDAVVSTGFFYLNIMFFSATTLCGKNVVTTDENDRRQRPLLVWPLHFFV